MGAQANHTDIKISGHVAYPGTVSSEIWDLETSEGLTETSIERTSSADEAPGNQFPALSKNFNCSICSTTRVFLPVIME